MTMPRYESMDSVKMTPGMVSTDPVMIVPKEFGKIYLNMMRLSFAPSVRAASTYS